VFEEGGVEKEPGVPSLVAHRHMRRWQRLRVKLPGQGTLAIRRSRNRERKVRTPSIAGVRGLGLDGMVNESKSLQPS